MVSVTLMIPSQSVLYKNTESLKLPLKYLQKTVSVRLNSLARLDPTLTKNSLNVYTLNVYAALCQSQIKTLIVCLFPYFMDQTDTDVRGIKQRVGANQLRVIRSLVPINTSTLVVRRLYYTSCFKAGVNMNRSEI